MEYVPAQVQFHENFQVGKKGMTFAASKGIGIAVMEPLRGGYLVSIVPFEFQEIWDSAGKKHSLEEWSLRYLRDRPEISVVLSGMSDIAQVKDNIKIAAESFPGSLIDKEKS